MKKKQALNVNNPDIVIEVKNFTKKFGHFIAVDNISFNVLKGTIHGFIGPNGAGKTTVIKSIVSAIKFKKGQINVSGFKNNNNQAKKLIGYIPEAARFPIGVSVFEYLVAMGRVGGLKTSEAKKRSEELLKKLDLWSFRRKSPNSFSSGMKKKVLLNQALLNNPEILILDEPAANLDPTARTELFNEIINLKKEGKTILISSHILAELQIIVDEITILNKGHVIYSQSIKNNEIKKYQVNSDNNDKLYEILMKHNFLIVKYSNKLIIKLKNIEEIKYLQSLSVKNNITLLNFNQEKMDLQELYEKLVLKDKLMYENEK